MRYLTNIEPYAGIERDVNTAASETGFDIRYVSHPIPYDSMSQVDAAESYDAGYDEKHSCGSIVFYGNEPVGDLSKFWRAFDKLRGLV